MVRWNEIRPGRGGAGEIGKAPPRERKRRRSAGLSSLLSNKKGSAKRKGAALILLAIGIYSVLWGVAAVRYDALMNWAEKDAHALAAKLDNGETRERALARVGLVQEIKVPLRPEYVNPLKTLLSIVAVARDEGVVDLLKQKVAGMKADLNGADLRGSDLCSADLSQAGLSRANLSSAKLRRVNFNQAHLNDAYLQSADLRHADLSNANLRGAILSFADLSGTDLDGVTAWHEIAEIKTANIHGVKNAPSGFREWALEHGAREVALPEDQSWLAYLRHEGN